MAKYTLIASRDPYESSETNHYYQLAADLKKAGNEVTLFLVQNGVFAARKSSKSRTVAGLSADGVSVMADSFSLRERGIADHQVEEKVTTSELDVIIDHLAEGRKVIWH